MQTRRLTIPILALTLLSACAINGRTPEGLAADYGVRVARTVGAAQEAVGAVGKASTVPAVKRGAVSALEGLQHVNTLGVQLADKLDAIRIARGAGTDTTNAVEQAIGLINQIEAAISLNVIPKLGDLPETRAALEAAHAITSLILEIQLQLARQQS